MRFKPIVQYKGTEQEQPKVHIKWMCREPCSLSLDHTTPSLHSLNYVRIASHPLPVWMMIAAALSLLCCRRLWRRYSHLANQPLNAAIDHTTEYTQCQGYRQSAMRNTQKELSQPPTAVPVWMVTAAVSLPCCWCLWRLYSHRAIQPLRADAIQRRSDTK